MFELLAVPQSGIPYIQMGYRIVFTAVTYFLLMAPMFFLAFSTFVEISAPAPFC